MRVVKLYHGLSDYIVDNPLVKACGLSPCTGRQSMVKLIQSGPSCSKHR